MDLLTKLRAASRLPTLLRLGRELDARRDWSAARMHEFRTERLLGTIRFCGAHVPFYRRKWAEHGVLLSQIQDESDLVRLPFTTKDELRADPGALMPAKVGRDVLVTINTSGSTGRMLSLSSTLEGVLLERAFFHRYWGHWGMSYARDPIAFFAGSIDRPRRDVSREPPRVTRLSAFDVDEARLLRYAKVLRDRRITFMLTYASLADRLASVVESTAELRGQLSLRGVFLGSERPMPSLRRRIEACLGCPTHAHYGMTETVALFQEFGHGGYSVVPDYGHVEFAPEVDTSGVREIIGTGFNNRAGLLVRYRTGDYAILAGDQSSALRWPYGAAVEDVVGRDADMIVTPSGRYVSITHLEWAMDRVTPPFRECQFRQDELDHVTLLAVPDADYAESRALRFVEEVRSRIGDGVEVELRLVDAIPRAGRQKLRLIDSPFGARLREREPVARDDPQARPTA
jgi:phenylacetate-CoA ligase